MNRKSTAPRILQWLFNAYQAIIGRGGQIDWTRVSSQYFAVGKSTVKLSAASAKGDTSLDVDALPKALKKGQTIDFGEVDSVTVTLSGNEAIGQTDLSVTALSAALPAGAILDFGSGENIVKLASAAAAGATSITISEALTVALESGDTATYKGGRKIAFVNADAAAGAVAVTVLPLEFALADNDEGAADETGTQDGLMLKSGTVMCRTSSDKLIPRVAGTGSGTETASEILQSDAYQNSKVAAKSGFGTYIGAQVFENLLPDADTDGNIPSLWKTELAANNAMVTFSDWSDSRFTD